MTVRMRLRVTALGAALLGSLSAFAQPGPGGPDNDRRPGPGGSGGAGGGPRPGRPGPAAHQRPGRPGPQRPGPDRGPGPNAGPLPPQIGRPLPAQYRGFNYRVDHWDRYGLPRPRRNHHWVQYGANFVLVGPSGLIVQLWGN